MGKVDLLGESIADLMTKLRGGQIPKAVGVQAGGLLAVRIPFVAKTIGYGGATGVYFFPDSCEVGAFTIHAGFGITNIVWYEMGAIGTIGAALEGAVYINNPTPGAANVASFNGIFHTAEVSTPAWSGGAYIGDPDSAGGRWIGGQVSPPGTGVGLGGMLIAWKYQSFGSVKVPKCLCYAAIAAM
jgi:hypothetical protein